MISSGRIVQERRGNLTHHNLGVLLRLGPQRLLAGRQAAGGGAKSAARNERGHWDGVGVGNWRVEAELLSGELGVAAWMCSHTIDFVNGRASRAWR